jgi:ADP-ribosylation factor protein 1
MCLRTYNGPCKILMQGLDAAGKTTLLYKIFKGRNIETTIPTIGFNVETAADDTSVVLWNTWDVGGRDKIRPLWRHYYQNTAACVFVVDSNDRERIDQAGEELRKMLGEEELQGVPLLVLANKQDLPLCMSLDEITAALGLHLYAGRRKWRVFPTVAIAGEGVDAALMWLGRQMAGEIWCRHGQCGDSGGRRALGDVIGAAWSRLRRSWAG